MRLWFEDGPIAGVRFALMIRRRSLARRYLALEAVQSMEVEHEEF
jgi:hypothetical protein